MRVSSITPKVVDAIPDKLEDGILYISESRNIALHKCCCGCGEEVVTPLNTEAGWRVIKQGANVSLCPSIGNWRFKCNSHYWIRNNKVDWSYTMTTEEIARVQERDRRDSQTYIAKNNAKKLASTKAKTNEVVKPQKTEDSGWLKILSEWLKGK